MRVPSGYTDYTLIPAYGRRYSSKEECLRDWADGKDFKILAGPYCSIRDFTVRDVLFVITNWPETTEIAILQGSKPYQKGEKQ